MRCTLEVANGLPRNRTPSAFSWVTTALMPSCRPSDAQIHGVDAPYDLCLGLQDFQGLLDLVSPFSRFHCAISERGTTTVPEPLPSVLLHGSCGVFAVFAGLVGIEADEDRADHPSGVVIPERLGQ